MSDFALGMIFAFQSMTLVAFMIGYGFYAADLWKMSK